MTDLAMVLVVSGAAGFQVRRLFRLRQKPRLRLHPTDNVVPTQVRVGNRAAHVWTIQLENGGPEPAIG